MGIKNLKTMIVYSSPAGTTLHVSQAICNTCKDLGYEPKMFDLGNRDERSKLHSEAKALGTDCCLWIGSPVYAGHAVHPILDFITQLPESRGSYAVPFVTWGAATSGIALHEMGKMLHEKDYTVLGAAKVVAVHSMMQDFENPLGKGHPDAEDDSMIEGLVGKVHTKLQSNNIKPINLGDLNYQPKEIQEVYQKINMEQAKQMMPPKVLNEESCIQCGICKDICPTDAITLNPYPQFGSECFLCYNCSRLCEQDAIKADLSQFAVGLRERAEKMAERPLSQIFI